MKGFEYGIQELVLIEYICTRSGIITRGRFLLDRQFAKEVNTSGYPFSYILRLHSNMRIENPLQNVLQLYINKYTDIMIACNNIRQF